MTASITDLRRRTSELVDEVKKGNEVEIESHGKPVVRLVAPLDAIPGDRLVQILKGLGPDPETANALESEIQKFRTSQRDERNLD